MGAIIGLGAWGGNFLDTNYQFSKPVFTIVLSLLGIGIGLYLIFKEVKQLNKEDDNSRKDQS